MKFIKIEGTWGTTGGNGGPLGSPPGEWSWGWDLSGFTYDPESLNGVIVPEPATWVLAALGMGLLAWVGLRRRGVPKSLMQ